MRATHFDKNKHKMFPWVTDWNDPQDHLRHSNDVKSMDFWTWFFFHPSAYKIIYYGMYVSLFMTMGIFALILIHYNLWIVAIFPGVVALGAVIGLIQRIIKYKYIKETTFYDIHMREYDKCNTQT